MKPAPPDPNADLYRRLQATPRAAFLLRRVSLALAECESRQGPKHPDTRHLTRIREALYECIAQGRDPSPEVALRVLEVIE